jgi:hypothetical protein
MISRSEHIFVASLIITALSTFACGKKKEEDEVEYGSLKVQFANASTAALAGTAAAPSEFGVKLKYVIAVEDKDGATADTGWNGNNKGNAAKIWANPACSSVTTSDDGVMVGEIKTDADCAAAGMGYFDLNRDTAAVNTDLNSQNAAVPVGTYRYIGMAFLGEQQGGNNTYQNINWAHADSGVTTQEYAKIQVEWTAKFAEPITISEGQKLTVTLSYDLAAAVTTGLAGAGQEKQAGGGTYQPGRYDDCDSSLSVCFDVPAFTLSAAAQ